MALALLCASAEPTASELVFSDQTSEVYYRFAGVAGEEIKVQKDGEVTGNLHSNDKIDLKKDSFVNGDVSAVGEIKNKGEVTGSITEGADPLALPLLLDAASLRALADRVFEVDVTFTDEVIDDVVFVDGDADLEGVTNGIGTIIATGKIRVSDDDSDSGSDGGGPPATLEPTTRLSLIALVDIDIGKDRRFRGVLRAGRDVKIEQRADFEGVIVAERKVEIKKDSRVTFLDFDQVAPEITLVSPRDGAVVASSTPEIVVEYSDGFSGLRAGSVTFLLDGTDRTGDATVMETGLTLTPSAPLRTVSDTVDS